MIVNIDTKRVTGFLSRHKEAVAVACVSIFVIRMQANRINSMGRFLDSRGLFDEYCSSSK